MTEQTYQVTLQTPLGNRYGTLIARRSGGRVSGLLYLLLGGEPFHGTVDSDGSCQIHGAFTTLMQTVPFVATGQLTSEAVHLRLHGTRRQYELTGTSGSNMEGQCP